MSTQLLRDLEALWQHEIPLTRAMQLRVASWENHQLRLELPLPPNANLHSSMFGGSLYCAALLAGWGWLHLRLQEAGLQGVVVIMDAQISYLLPVTGAAQAVCTAPDAAAWQKFGALFARKGLARLQLNTQVLTEHGAVAALFSGQFVLRRAA